ncbi:MAG: sugar kinase [Thermoguttaceae bacterium]|nr:sugar kinase [Thermoguttaceae bacterium]
MAPLLTIGSAAFDSIETPFGSRERLLGGSGVYASFAAGFFTDVRLLGVVGEDWNPEYTELLRNHRVALDGFETRAGEKTCFWSGRYFDDMNQRETLCFEGNVMAKTWIPRVPESYVDSPYVFLGNGSPVTDAAVLDAIAKPRLVVADTMDFYINGMNAELLALLPRVDGLIVNDGEATLLTGEKSPIVAGRKILEMGPKFAVVKKGEHGAMFVGPEEIYLIPAYPTTEVVDPTGAGDSFAGAFMGYLAAAENLTPENIKNALIFATVVASFNVEGFGLEKFRSITREQIDARAARFKAALC